jgi:tRNA threonylcarbamoyladenosine biosynthesis protein TsaB
MKILALETSTEYCSVALWQDGAVTERSELVGQKHSELLMEMIDVVLQGSALKIQDINGIGFGKGPGSFTGVRIACGVAQGLALGVDVNVAGICTLEALAQASGHDKVIAALDARMNEIYLAAYEKCAAGWKVVIEPCLCKAEAAPVVEGEAWFGVGSGFTDPLKSHYEKQLIGVDAGAAPAASAIAQLAAIEFANGRSVDAALALPLYLRDKVALTTSERGGK